MKILALNPCGSIGGAERSLMDVLAGLTARGHAVSLAAPPNGALLAAASAKGIPVREWSIPETFLKTGRYSGPLRLATAAAASTGAVWSLARLVRGTRPQILYSNGIKSHFLSAAIGPFARVPMVWHVRDFVCARRLAQPLFRLARCTAAVVIANSRAVAGEWEQHQIPNEVVHNGLLTSGLPPDTARDRGRTVRLLSAGILAPWKGFDRIIRGCSLLPARVDWRLTICGGELYDTDGHRGVRDELESLARELGVADRVVFTGMVDDLTPYLRQSDLFLHGSIKPEPFGRVVAEAMREGVPVIATAAGGIPEFVRHGADGLLYPMGDCEALRDAIAALAEDPEQRCAMGVSARQRIQDDFSIEATVHRIEQILVAAAEGKR